MKTKGLSCEVYRNDLGDCTNGGISSTHKSLIIDKTDGPFEGDAANSVKIEVKNFNGYEYKYVVPVNQPEGMCGPMFGGNFIYSSDSRFAKISKYPLPIHDRFEIWEQYEALSK